ncbi:MAG: cytochrome C biogenesis protein [Acidobacteria bacterium]|nr:MAG: cytochrome C biogenesis protein [Acidobacteriota bacterium]
MSEFGNFCLLFAFCLALYAIFAALIGAVQKQHRIVRSAERAAFACGGAITLAMLSLLYLLVTSDFSVSHVASATNRDLPFYYKIAALWGAHDGSMVLWCFVTAVFSCVAIYQNRYRYRDMMPYVVAVLMFNLAFFLCLNLFLSNPFNQLVAVNADGTMEKFVPRDGRGLNPSLQYWAMVIHPPILYHGFIGFVVPFAFAFAALVTRQLGDAWIRTIRRWTLVPWLFLGVGLILGGKWAYVELGWGGYWGWDPVENSSLMPWLTGTAFLHSVIIQERKGMLKVWNVFLITLTYLLGIFGTFITRSGIVNSVHAFADSSLGPFFVVYMTVVFCASMYLILDRLPYLKSERQLDSVVSRESAFLFNNLILLIACFSIFWGVMFPVFSEWLRGTKMTVGPPFFNNVNIPIGLFLLFLTGVGPLFAWRKTSLESLKKAFVWPVAFSVVAAAALVAAGMRSFYAVMSFTLCVFVVATIVQEFYKGSAVRARNTGESMAEAALRRLHRPLRRRGHLRRADGQRLQPGGGQDAAPRGVARHRPLLSQGDRLHGRGRPELHLRPTGARGLPGREAPARDAPGETRLQVRRPAADHRGRASQHAARGPLRHLRGPCERRQRLRGQGVGQSAGLLGLVRHARHDLRHAHNAASGPQGRLHGPARRPRRSAPPGRGDPHEVERA